MRILSRLFGKHENASDNENNRSINLAFVLLSEARLPDAEAIARAFREFATPGEDLHGKPGDSGRGRGNEVISLRLT